MTCERLEDDDLLGHLGEEMDPHVEQCHVCRATAYGYARLAAALAQESTRPLPPGWRDRTLARIHVARTARRRRHAAAVGMSLAAAAALILVVRPRIGDPGHPRGDTGELVVSIERVQGRRGPADSGRAHPGDRLHASASARAKHVELRLYRGPHDLIARCPGVPAPTCQRRAAAIELSWTFAVLGNYRIVWLTSPSPLPPPSGDLDADLLAAEQAGAHVMERGPIDVN
jgi:hypothetical protein